MKAPVSVKILSLFNSPFLHLVSHPASSSENFQSVRTCADSVPWTEGCTGRHRIGWKRIIVKLALSPKLSVFDHSKWLFASYEVIHWDVVTFLPWYPYVAFVIIVSSAFMLRENSLSCSPSFSALMVMCDQESKCWE